MDFFLRQLLEFYQNRVKFLKTRVYKNNVIATDCPQYTLSFFQKIVMFYYYGDRAVLLKN